ncbi:peptidoglycan-associated lipoprotein [Betaproteobacteria bacterium]|nr:peptidoglycan-associated lipoprotein [Betaproteobacteria bacterium]GHU42785.1 peptidoglycan-associated lipoprotein [Betaproteobacteria bacterium]
MKNFAVVLTLLLAIAACSTTSGPETGGAPVETRDPNAGVTRVDVPPPNGANLPAILTSGVLAQRSIYFALDRYDVAEEYRGLLTAHAKFLVENRQFKILIQGNTDERGSHEYNLSLGQKRAEAVKQTLTLLGVRDDQIEAVSLGEEKPRAEGHDESAWAQNRRADILYSGEF